MTLVEFTRDVVPILMLIVTAGGLYFIWGQLNTAINALKQTSSWNKIHATYNFFDLSKNARIERDLYGAGERIGVSFNKVLSAEDLKKVLADNDCYLYAKEFLNDFESLCAAYQVGALDKPLAYQMYSTRIAKEFIVFQPLIKHMRTQFKDPAILIELQKTASEWRKRLDNEKKKVEEIIKAQGLSGNPNL